MGDCCNARLQWAAQAERADLRLGSNGALCLLSAATTLPPGPSTQRHMMRRRRFTDEAGLVATTPPGASTRRAACQMTGAVLTAADTEPWAS
jgi:hypothetical protein